ncbi:hypothetical protein Dimus_004728 [Dionaea muscipula]
MRSMNLYDFFTFIVRIGFANIVLLYFLLDEYKVSSWVSHPLAGHTTLNLLCIRRLASQMKSTCLAKHHDISLDFKKTLKDPVFLDLCAVIYTTYQKLYVPCDSTRETGRSTSSAFLEDSDFLEAFGPAVSTPEDLISLVDCAIRKISISPISEFLPGSKLDGEHFASSLDFLSRIQLFHHT